MNENLEAIRKELLQVQVKKKLKIYEIAKHKKVSPLIKACEDELMSGMESLKKLYELEAAGVEAVTE